VVAANNLINTSLLQFVFYIFYSFYYFFVEFAIFYMCILYYCIVQEKNVCIRFFIIFITTSTLPTVHDYGDDIENPTVQDLYTLYLGSIDRKLDLGFGNFITHYYYLIILD